MKKEKNVPPSRIRGIDDPTAAQPNGRAETKLRLQQWQVSADQTWPVSTTVEIVAPWPKWNCNPRSKISPTKLTYP